MRNSSVFCDHEDFGTAILFFTNQLTCRMLSLGTKLEEHFGSRVRFKLMMAMEGGLSSRMQDIESLDVFTDAYEDVLRVCEKLEKIYKAIEEDFSKVEGIIFEWHKQIIS